MNSSSQNRNSHNNYTPSVATDIAISRRVDYNGIIQEAGRFRTMPRGIKGSGKAKAGTKTDAKTNRMASVKTENTESIAQV